MAFTSTRRSRGPNSSKKSSSYILVTLAGLLSSSCCIIQLILNVFSVSCAGFSILNPYRSFFLLLTFSVIAGTIWKYGLLTRPTLTTLVIAGLLSASPEFVKLYNEGGGLESLLRGEAVVDDLTVFELEMMGLSCQACANRVKLWIEKQEGVVRCDVFLEQMKAVVRSRPGTFQSEAQLESLVAASGKRYYGKVVKQYNSTTMSGIGDEVEDKIEP